jgi:dTDP-4-amino-4,6-dideoxygalactose transaminase
MNFRVPLGYQDITWEDKIAVCDVLESGQLSPGPKVREFENAFAKRHDARHGLFVNSGTDALRIALSACKERFGWKDGDLIAVPTITFVATVNVILQVGLKPLFIDVGQSDYNMNDERLEVFIRNSPDHYAQLRAIMPVHMFGQPCRMTVFKKLAKKYGMKIIEDSCESIGIAPLSGDIACYSTYVCHMISTGVGGLAITNDDDLSLLMRSYANHGRSTNYIPGFSQCTDIKKRFVFDRIGYSSRMTEMEAVLGLGQLKRLDGYITSRQEIAERLYDGLFKFKHLILPEVHSKHGFMMFPITLHTVYKRSWNKWNLCKYLESRGIETREMLPLINQPCYKSLEIDESSHSVAQWINETGFYIGCHPGMTDADVRYVIEAFGEFFNAQKKNHVRPKKASLVAA